MRTAVITSTGANPTAAARPRGVCLPATLSRVTRATDAGLRCPGRFPATDVSDMTLPAWRFHTELQEAHRRRVGRWETATRPSSRSHAAAGEGLGSFPRSTAAEHPDRACTRGLRRLAPGSSRAREPLSLRRDTVWKDELTDDLLMTRGMGKVKAEAGGRRPGSNRHELHGQRAERACRQAKTPASCSNKFMIGDAGIARGRRRRDRAWSFRSRSRPGGSARRSSAATPSSSSRPRIRRSSRSYVRAARRYGVPPGSASSTVTARRPATRSSDIGPVIVPPALPGDQGRRDEGRRRQPQARAPRGSAAGAIILVMDDAPTSISRSWNHLVLRDERPALHRSVARGRPRAVYEAPAEARRRGRGCASRPGVGGRHWMSARLINRQALREGRRVHADRRQDGRGS